MPSVELLEVNFYRLDMQTRFPFQYGIASMTALPHLMLVVTAGIDGRRYRGVAADGLPPKWFTKNVGTTFEQDDLPAMHRVIAHARDVGLEMGSRPSFFSWWLDLYNAQHQWAAGEQIPQLLSAFGVSLIERAVLDALCRAYDTALHYALRSGLLDVDLAIARHSLSDVQLNQVLPDSPIRRVDVRHTVGLGDPLTSSSCAAGDDPRDGLPFTLEENIDHYGLRYFKIKLSGDETVDRDRLTEIAEIVGRKVGSSARFTLDGNENYRTIESFRAAWSNLLASSAIRSFVKGSLLFVEQPIHRDVALDESVRAQLDQWKEAPPIIIDESDADLSSLPRALVLGYSGTSHKNCKGIMKGVLGAATIHAETSTQRQLILSAEDLANVGPVALLQDLAVVAAFGIPHVERNGHHYFAGLGMFPKDVQEDVFAHHGDLYRNGPGGIPSLAIDSGGLSLESVNAAPFGAMHIPNTGHLSQWDF